MTTLSDLKLNPTQISALVVLMAEARPLSNPEMRELAGFDLSSDRKLLAELDLVKSDKKPEKKDRLLYHELTEYGWRKTRDLLRIEAIGGNSPTRGALKVLMSALDRHFQERRLSPSDFFYRDPGTAVESSVEPSVETGLEQAIRLAYKNIATKPGEWVGLAEIRAAVSYASRADQDTAIKDLAVQPDVDVVPIANLKSLSPEDRAAAIKLGGELKHAIAIEG